MRAVYKYVLKPSFGGRCVVEMPPEAPVVMVGAQGEDVCVWVLVELPVETFEEREFFVYGTGHDIQDDDLVHLGSAMLFDGQLVFHVFEEQPNA